MDIKDILKKVDHTLLSPVATKKDIETLCLDSLKFNTASVCIPSCYIEYARSILNNKGKICTVIGFPLGYGLEEDKLAECEHALNKGVDEIDMVINICNVKNKLFNVVEDEIRNIKNLCNNNILKVIIETCYLTEEEKIRMCHVVSNAGADYIKTSTGFGSGGATIADIVLMKKYVSENVKIKAAGGISSLKDAEDFILSGADRLGTSKIVALAKETMI